MNNFESDIKRAILSPSFVIAVILQYLILDYKGMDSELFRIAMPVLCTFPYSCGWLSEYKGGFVKYSLYRSSFKSYILSKFITCGIAGGLCEVLGLWLFNITGGEGDYHYGLLFLAAFLWASVATTLAAISGSRYIAYGSSFVIHYFLVIMCDRYIEDLYCLNPCEWYAPTHTWVFEETGVGIMLVLFIVLIGIAYYFTVREKLKNV